MSHIKKQFLLLIISFSSFSALGQTSTPGNSLINGKPLPMVAAKSTSETIVLNTKEGLGDKELITFRTVRAKGTRSPIHMHPHGGQTCVLSGEMTLYLDGAEPLKASAGSCYWMPPNRRMSGVNTADGETIMLDSFVVPTGSDIWVVVEPGLGNTSNQFDKTHHQVSPRPSN